VKAQIDILFLVVVSVAVVIALFILYAIFQGGLKPQLQSVLGTGQNANTVNTILNSGSRSLDTLNNGLMFIYFAMATAIIIGAFLVQATPIFFIAGIFFVAIDILIATIMRNVFFTVMQTSFLAPYLNQYPYLVILVEGYPIITFIIAIIVLIVTFSPKGGNY
jgi:hypothetical protein